MGLLSNTGMKFSMDWLHKMFIPWWRHDIEMLSTLLALWWENLQFCGAFNFVSVCLNKLLNKESWRSCGVTVQDHNINSMDWLHTNFHHMMASWHGNAFHITGPLGGRIVSILELSIVLVCLPEQTVEQRFTWRHAHQTSLYRTVTSRSSGVIVQNCDVTLIWRHCT